MADMTPAENQQSMPAVDLRSDDIADGVRIPDAHIYDRGNLSPHLSWSGAPEGTASYAITCFDPDARQGKGWWHWLLFDIPSNITALSTGDVPPHGAQSALNDFGDPGYSGPNPPDGPAHRYIFTIYALDIPSLGLSPDPVPAQVEAAILRHALAKGSIITEFGY